MFIEINQRGVLWLLNLDHIMDIRKNSNGEGITIDQVDGTTLKFDIAYEEIANWLNDNELIDRID